MQRGLALQNELSRIVDALPDLAWTALQNGDMDFVNRRWCEFTGLTAEESSGTGWQAAVHPDDVTELLAVWRSVPESGRSQEKLVRLRQGDGAYCRFIFRSAALSEASGAFRKWCGTGTDVDALAASERNLTQSVNALPTTAWSMEPDGCCDFLNHRWLDYAGYTAEQARGWGWAAVIHPDDAQGLRDHWQACLYTGTPVNTEAHMRGRDGQYRWFLFRANPLPDDSGTIIKWYGTNVDIEDRKQADEALKASERALIQVINTIPTTAWSTRPDGYCEFLSQRWLDYAGFTVEEAQGWGWAAVIHPDDAQGLTEYWQACLDSGTPVDTEARMRGRDGTYRWFLFRANPLRDESGTIIRWYGTNVDIEDRRRTDNILRLSREFLAKGQRLSSTGSFSWRVNSDELEFSDELRRIFEIEPGVPVTLDRVIARVHPEDMALVAEKIERAREGSDDLDYEIRLLMPDGSMKFVHTNAYGTRDPSGVVEVIGATQDITERRLADNALIDARAELERVARITTLGAVTASIAHEVSQPLSVIITNAGTCLRLLGADPPNLGAATEAAQRIVFDGKRASDVIARLRSLFAKKKRHGRSAGPKRRRAGSRGALFKRAAEKSSRSTRGTSRRHPSSLGRSSSNPASDREPSAQRVRRLAGRGGPAASDVPADAER